MTDTERLTIACDSVLIDPDLVAEDKGGNKAGSKNFDGDIVKTYCNFGVSKIAQQMGCDDFVGKMANDIYAFVKKNWKAGEGVAVNAEANKGRLAIAAVKGNPHGHVAVIYPGAMVWSSKWQKECPVVANVGKRNAVMGANWAFEDEPEYFLEP